MRESGRAHPYARHVASLLERDGFLDVTLEREEPKAVWRSRGMPSISFDIGYRVFTPLPATDYVECKYKRDGLATPQDVAKFIADLRLCAIAPQRGLVVTNHGYEPRTQEYARQEGIRLYVVPARGEPPTGGRHIGAVLRRLQDRLRGVEAMPQEFVQVN